MVNFLALFCGFRKPNLELLGFDWSQIICSAYVYRCMSTHAYLCVLLHFVFHQHTQHVYTIIGRSCHRHHFCHDKSVVATSLLLSWQKHVCHNKTWVLSQQKYACRDKTFVETKLCLSRQTHAKVDLSWQNFCQDNIMLVATNVCPDKTFVPTKICLSRQTFYHKKHTFVTTKDVFCHDKHVHMFVATNTFVTTKLFSWQNDTDGCSRQWWFTLHLIKLMVFSRLPLCPCPSSLWVSEMLILKVSVVSKLFLLFLYGFMSRLSVALRPQKP